MLLLNLEVLNLEVLNFLGINSRKTIFKWLFKMEEDPKTLSEADFKRHSLLEKGYK